MSDHDGRSAHAPAPQQPGHAHHTVTSRRSSAVTSITDAVVAKDGEPFFLCRPDGQVPCKKGHGYGLYHHDCRYLGGYELRIGGARPETLAATERGGTLLLELTNPAIDADDGEAPVERDQLGLTWSREVDASGPSLQDDLRVQNFGSADADLLVELKFAAGFEDIFVIRGLTGEPTGQHQDPAWRDGALVFGYAGADEVERQVEIRVHPSPEEQRPDGAALRLHVKGRGEARLRVAIKLRERATGGSKPIEGRGSPQNRPRRNTGGEQAPASSADDREWIGGHGWATALSTSSFALRRAMGRALDDLALLRGELEGQRYYAAGVPWFSTLFGRDSLITAFQSLAFDPEVAAETLRLLAARQGTHDDSERAEQPGKILHELRIGELARIGAIPQTPYYGTVDATPLFLVLLAEHARWTGSLDLFRELHGAASGALDWIDRTIAGDDSGFLTYSGEGKHGLANQGWKDSGNAIVTADGDLAKPPIALAEVQGYVWRAWQAVAELFERDGDAERAGRLRDAAKGLQGRFEERFWSDRLGCYVLALGDGKPCEVLASNAGQVLWTGIARDDRAGQTAKRLLQPDMFGGWGVRTLSTGANAYHPIGYHLGTIWPHDNSLIAGGLRRYGCDDEAEQLFLGLLEGASRLQHDRLPECFAGFGMDEFSVPVPYPVACHPQAWAAGAIPLLLTTVLGLEPDGFNGVLDVRRPRLPQGIERIELRDLPVGRGKAHLRFTREDDRTDVEVVEATDVEIRTSDKAPAGAGKA